MDNQTKVCIKCRIDKPLIAFHINKETRDGRHSSCKECKLAYERNRQKTVDREKANQNNYKTYQADAKRLLWSLDVNKVREAIASSSSTYEVGKKLIPENQQFFKNVYRVIHLYAKENNINIDHFELYLDYTLENKDEVFCKESVRNRNSLKKLIFKHNLIPYICDICKLEPIWNGKKLVLRLDHIDGDTYNNLLTNLRFLCPNCDSQTDSFCGKNKGKYIENETKNSNR